MPLKSVYFYLLLSIVIMAVGFGIKIFNVQNNSLQLNSSTTIEKGHSTGTPMIGGSFSLINQDGNIISNETYRGKYVLIFFGYTFCPDICPSTLSNFSSAMDLLGNDAMHVKPVFVSIDPARDSPEALKSYLTHFHKSFDGLTGNLEQIKHIKKIFRIFAVKSQASEPGSNNYLMDHSSISYLLGPDGKFITFFRYGAEAEVIATKLKNLF